MVLGQPSLHTQSSCLTSLPIVAKGMCIPHLTANQETSPNIDSSGVTLQGNITFVTEVTYQCLSLLEVKGHIVRCPGLMGGPGDEW